jgi:hypothetical protein
MATQVINVRSAPRGWETKPGFVYIGRAGHGLAGTFGNPFRLEPGSERGSTLDRYQAWLDARLETDARFAALVGGLKGRTLVCFCKPLRCHGDHLAAAAERLG